MPPKERKVNKMKWIPVAESLPGPYESVLVTAAMNDEEPLVYQAARGCGGVWELYGVRNYRDYEVTAWMPLPEAYNGH